MAIEGLTNLSLPTSGANQAYINVSALEAGILRIPLHLFVAGASPSEISVCPSLAFFLRHSESKSQLVFDLGVRRDLENVPPAIRAALEQWPVDVPQSVTESLTKGGVEAGDVEVVVLSHLHFDQYVRKPVLNNQTIEINGGLTVLGMLPCFRRPLFLRGRLVVICLHQDTPPTPSLKSLLHPSRSSAPNFSMRTILTRLSGRSHMHEIISVTAVSTSSTPPDISLAISTS